MSLCIILQHLRSFAFYYYEPTKQSKTHIFHIYMFTFNIPYIVSNAICFNAPSA